MPTGYKYTSETFTIRAVVTETLANTFTESIVQTNLDSLSREVLIIQRVDLDPNVPDGVPGVFSAVNASVANETQTTNINIDNPDCIASAQLQIVSGAPGDSVGFSSHQPESQINSDDPLYIVATDDLFLGVRGVGNVNPKSCFMVIHARRARASADTYAAILTSQFN